MKPEPLKRRLSGDRNQCPACGEYFNSTAAFEKHRAGDYGLGLRRCLPIDEMRGAGMATNAQGFWVTAPFEAGQFEWTRTAKAAFA
jgi:hypothetical protein